MKRVLDLTLSNEERDRLYSGLKITYEEDDNAEEEVVVEEFDFDDRPRSSSKYEQQLEDHIIQVFTDGSCTDNGKKYALGGIGIHFPNKELPDVSAPYKGFRLTICHETGNIISEEQGPYENDVTNQRAELSAIQCAVELAAHAEGYIPKKTHIHLYTDSSYCINSLTNWCYTWENNNWRTSNGKGVKNLDIIQSLLSLIRQHRVVFFYSKAHTNSSDEKSRGNAVADSLATKATAAQRSHLPEKIKKPKKKRVKINPQN